MKTRLKGYLYSALMATLSLAGCVLAVLSLLTMFLLAFYVIIAVRLRAWHGSGEHIPSLRWIMEVLVRDFERSARTLKDEIRA